MYHGFHLVYYCCAFRLWVITKVQHTAHRDKYHISTNNAGKIISYWNEPRGLCNRWQMCNFALHTESKLMRLNIHRPLYLHYTHSNNSAFYICIIIIHQKFNGSFPPLISKHLRALHYKSSWSCFWVSLIASRCCTHPCLLWMFVFESALWERASEVLTKLSVLSLKWSNAVNWHLLYRSSPHWTRWRKMTL